MNVSALIALAIGAALFGAQLWLGSSVIRGNRSRFAAMLLPAWQFAVLIEAAHVLYWTATQYRVWHGDPVAKFLLPPYQSWSYFIGYVSDRFIGPFILSIAAAIFLMYIARTLNRRFGGRFFEPEEPVLFGIGVFLCGYPGMVFYVPLMLLVGALLTLWYQLRAKGRAPLYFLWLPVSLLAILITYFLLPPVLIAQFGF